MDVSIIIVNYNTKHITHNCIESIVSFTKNISYEIILVDNASSDGSIDFFKEYEGIRFINSEVNLGFGRANNLGLTKASGKYIFLLNSDTLLLNNAVKDFYDAMELEIENIACLGTKLLAEDGVTENNSYGVFPTINSIFKSLFNIYLPFTKSKTNLNTADTFEVNYIIGADLFIRKKVIDELGLFDPDFFMYFEETNMQLRYNKAGYKNKIISAPKIIHLENGSDMGSKRYSYVSRKYYFTSMFLYLKKRYSFFKYLITRIIAIGYLPLYYKTDLKFKEKLKLTSIFLFHK